MRKLVALCVWSAIVSFASAQSNAPGLKIAPGFEVIEYADGNLANDIHCMTVDPKGRVIVAGRGYIRILVDDNGDGRADRAHEFAQEPKDGAMGLLWENDTLFATGDGGLRRFTSKDGTRADGPSTLIRAMKTGGEHAAHAIRRGPDGWLYVLCGNNTGIDKRYADLLTSPIKEPTAGCVLRFEPELKKCEIVAHGFRNPYGMDFNLDGELFTYDSDNERCVSLPWYEPTRFYHVIEGRHYGWLNPQHTAFWRRPPYFADVVAPIATLGRGSPTGVACYRHTQFPPEYQGGFFLADWTFGRIYFVKLERAGATYKATPSVFLESIGEHGFAPTACAVDDTTGDLYVSIGGRGTRGAVYRVRHPERYKAMKKELGPLGMARRGPAPLDNEIPRNSPAALERGLILLASGKEADKRLQGIRLIQLGLGDIGSKGSIGTIWEGYTAKSEPEGQGVAKKVASHFPAGDVALDRELARTLAMLGHDNATLRRQILEHNLGPRGPVEDIHYLACYARLAGTRTADETAVVAKILLGLDRAIVDAKLKRDSNWPLRVRELVAGLVAKDKSLPTTIVDDATFGRPEHALFANADGFPSERAARIFLKRWRDDKSYPLTGDIVQLLGTLPVEDVLPLARERWGETGQEYAFIGLLAKSPVASDRKRFLDALNSPQGTVIEACVRGLDRLEAKPDGEEAFALIRALHRSSDKQAALRKLLAERLQKTTGQAHGNDSKAWIAWLESKHPELGKRLANPDGVNLATWTARLAKINWGDGKSEPGRKVFAKAKCAQCHSGSQALGPDLAGIANRFSQADLVTAILQPSKDVPARYQTTLVETKDGKTFQGIVIYDAVDSLILQTDATQTVRLDGAAIESRHTTFQSLMPAGLLDGLPNSEIADLFAYLRSLGKS